MNRLKYNPEIFSKTLQQIEVQNDIETALDALKPEGDNSP